jgi:hypothetical protein
MACLVSWRRNGNWAKITIITSVAVYWTWFQSYCPSYSHACIVTAAPTQPEGRAIAISWVNCTEIVPVDPDTTGIDVNTPTEWATFQWENNLFADLLVRHGHDHESFLLSELESTAISTAYLTIRKYPPLKVRPPSLSTRNCRRRHRLRIHITSLQALVISIVLECLWTVLELTLKLRCELH